MYELPAYQFGVYTFRPAREEDVMLARAWNAQDKDHKWEKHYPNYWIEQSATISSYLLADQWGTVFFMKSIRHSREEVEITLQFDRRYKNVSALRAMRGLIAGFEWLKKALPMNGYRAVWFVTKNPALALFAEKVLGFEHEGQRYIYRLTGKGNGNGDERSTEASSPEIQTWSA